MRKTEIERKLNRLQRVVTQLVADVESLQRAIKKLKANEKTFQIYMPTGDSTTSTTASATIDYTAGVDFVTTEGEEKPKKKKKKRKSKTK